MIQALIDEYIAKENARKSIERAKKTKWSPSSFGRCFRYQYWQRQGEEPSNPPDARTLRVFQSGNTFHDFVEGIVVKQHPDAKCEVPCGNDDVEGTADLVLPDEVVDFKTVHSKSFHWITKNPKPIKEQKFTNVLQVMTYAWLLGKPKGRLVLISKDDLCILEYGFTLDGEWLEHITNEVKCLNSFTELPPAKPRAYKNNKGEYQECRYCQFSNQCNQKEGKDNATTS